MAAMRRPAEVFPPGEFLREELEERGWSQTDLAEILGRPFSVVNELLAGKRGISPETAMGLAAALGTSAELWMNLEASYQLAKVDPDKGDAVARRAKLYSKAPIKEMCRRGWLEDSENLDVLETRVKRFFRISDLDETPELPYAARKSTSYEEALTPVQRAWLFRAFQLASAVQAQEFSREKLEAAIPKLRALAHISQEARHVAKILAEAGVRLVVVQPLQGSKIDGACFLVDENSPAIALSLRFDRIDNFWFVLMHEIKHLLNGDLKVIDIDLDSRSTDDDVPDAERLANEFANDTLLPKGKLEGFIARVSPLYSQRRVEAFAQSMQIHPGIVVGQLQHRGEISYSTYRKTLEPVREWVAGSALTDGWGMTPPAGL